MTEFSLKEFERLVYGREHYDAAGAMLVRLLEGLDLRYGSLGGIGLEADDERPLLRIASAITNLFCDPGFRPNESGFHALLPYHRWIAAIFGSTGFGTADHILAQYVEGRSLKPENLTKFCLLQSLECEFAPSLDALHRVVPEHTLAMGIAQVATRWAISPRAHERREHMLSWLPEKLANADLPALSPRGLHHAWLHSCYAPGPKGREFRRALNVLLRKDCYRMGIRDVARGQRQHGVRPVMVLVLDWFHTNHVVFRSFGNFVRCLRERFELHGLFLHEPPDADVAGLFDRVDAPLAGAYQSDTESLPTLQELAARITAGNPDIVLHMGVGMTMIGLFLANVRLAPVQVATHGNPASTNCRAIDYFLMEERYAPAAPLHSETPLYVPNDTFGLLPSQPVAAEGKPEGLDIAVMVTPMKLNAPFLEVCRKVLEAAPSPARLHVLVGTELGLARRFIERSIKAQIPQAILHWQMDKPETMKALAGFDMALTPFPVGNSNSLIDCASQGLPCVILEAGEIGGRMAAHTWRRLGLEEKLITKSVPEYVETAIALARDTAWRQGLRRAMRERFSSAQQLEVCRGNPLPAVDALHMAAAMPQAQRSGTG